jgi:hypothetical protein
MGARMFSPDTGRYIQEDQYEDAVGDLNLGSDPLTGDRYGLAGGNPVGFVEIDGHEPASSFTSGCDSSYGRHCSGAAGRQHQRSVTKARRIQRQVTQTGS